VSVASAVLTRDVSAVTLEAFSEIAVACWLTVVESVSAAVLASSAVTSELFSPTARTDVE
jgi:hypothetical protein